MSTKIRRLALTRLQEPTDNAPLLVLATGPFIGEGFDCPMLDALFLASSLAKRAPGYLSLGFPDPRTSASRGD